MTVAGLFLPPSRSCARSVARLIHPQLDRREATRLSPCEVATTVHSIKEDRDV